jgi:hypothetical protein
MHVNEPKTRANPENKGVKIHDLVNIDDPKPIGLTLKAVVRDHVCHACATCSIKERPPDIGLS